MFGLANTIAVGSQRGGQTVVTSVRVRSTLSPPFGNAVVALPILADRLNELARMGSEITKRY